MSVFSSDKEEEFLNEYVEGDPSDLVNFVFTEGVILNALSKLKENKAAGTDELSSNLLVNISQSLSLPLAMVFQKSLDTSDVPKQWKEANVKAIFKGKGSRNCPGNYRPVSLTSQV